MSRYILFFCMLMWSGMAGAMEERIKYLEREDSYTDDVLNKATVLSLLKKLQVKSKRYPSCSRVCRVEIDRILRENMGWVRGLPKEVKD